MVVVGGESRVEPDRLIVVGKGRVEFVEELKGKTSSQVRFRFLRVDLVQMIGELLARGGGERNLLLITLAEKLEGIRLANLAL